MTRAQYESKIGKVLAVTAGEKMRRVLCQRWKRYELGMGVKPCGLSLHLTEEERKLFVTDYFASVEREAIDEFASPDGDPFWHEVDTKIFEDVQNQSEKYGVWFSHELPSS